MRSQQLDYYMEWGHRQNNHGKSFAINNKLRMHDLVRDMGREVVWEKFPFEPGKRSRFWFHEDATRVISKEEGSKAIEGLVLNQPRPTMHLNTKTFAVMQKLRLLQINNVLEAFKVFY